MNNYCTWLSLAGGNILILLVTYHQNIDFWLVIGPSLWLKRKITPGRYYIGVHSAAVSHVHREIHSFYISWVSASMMLLHCLNSTHGYHRRVWSALKWSYWHVSLPWLYIDSLDFFMVHKPFCWWAWLIKETISLWRKSFKANIMCQNVYCL